MISNLIRKKLPLHSNRLTIMLLSTRNYKWYSREVRKEYFNRYLDSTLAMEMTQSDVEKNILKIVMSYKYNTNSNEIRLVLFDRDSRKNIGGVTIYNNISHIELAYWICSDSQGMGYATEALQTVIKTIRSIDASLVIRLVIQEKNKSSIALANRLGFKVINKKPGRHCINLTYELESWC